MNVVFIGAAVICLTIAAAQVPEDEVSRGQACLKQRAVEQKNKEIVGPLVVQVFNDHDLSNVDKYIHKDFIDHDVNVEENGAEAFKVWATEWNNKTKGKLEILRISAEGDLVWNHLRSPNPEGKEVVIMEAFKLKDGQIVEHWDVIQPVGDLSKSKNPHPFF